QLYAPIIVPVLPLPVHLAPVAPLVSAGDWHPPATRRHRLQERGGRRRGRRLPARHGEADPTGARIDDEGLLHRTVISLRLTPDLGGGLLRLGADLLRGIGRPGDSLLPGLHHVGLATGRDLG